MKIYSVDVTLYVEVEDDEDIKHTVYDIIHSASNKIISFDIQRPENLPFNKNEGE